MVAVPATADDRVTVAVGEIDRGKVPTRSVCVERLPKESSSCEPNNRSRSSPPLATATVRAGAPVPLPVDTADAAAAAAADAALPRPRLSDPWPSPLFSVVFFEALSFLRFAENRFDDENGVWRWAAPLLPAPAAGLDVREKAGALACVGRAFCRGVPNIVRFICVCLLSAWRLFFRCRGRSGSAETARIERREEGWMRMGQVGVRRMRRDEEMDDIARYASAAGGGVSSPGDLAVFAASNRRKSVASRESRTSKTRTGGGGLTLHELFVASRSPLSSLPSLPRCDCDALPSLPPARPPVRSIPAQESPCTWAVIAYRIR